MPKEPTANYGAAQTRSGTIEMGDRLLKAFKEAYGDAECEMAALFWETLKDGAEATKALVSKNFDGIRGMAAEATKSPGGLGDPTPMKKTRK